MIPHTYPSNVSGNKTRMVVYSLPSVTGLQAWVDYIPVKFSTSGLENHYDGHILSNALSSITGLQAWKDYIPVFVNNALTRPFTTDADGYIPISDVGVFEINFILSGTDILLANATGDFITSI
jgi:hypothetical protein